MQSGQVSVWVPIAVGIIGVIGVIGVIAGQFFSAWREDRRWEREQIRDETKARQQRELEILRLKQESRSQWREIRLVTYGKMLKSANEALHLSRKTQYAVKTADDVREIFDRFNRELENFKDAALEAVIMTESPKLGTHLGNYPEHLGIFFPISRLEAVIAESKTFYPNKDEREKMERVYKQNHLYYMKLRDLIKEELGVSIADA
jgi:hypothetical protein